MRVVIAAGGTGGHIYPALAVARSLRALPAAPELAWIGGDPGPGGGDRSRERDPVLAAGPALAAQRWTRRPPGARSAPTGGVVPAGTLAPGPPATGRDLHERWLRRDPDPRGGPG